MDGVGRHRPGGENLVLYPDLLTTSDVFEVHDPDGLLPRSRRRGIHESHAEIGSSPSQPCV